MRGALAADQAEWVQPFRSNAYDPRRLVRQLDLVLRDPPHQHQQRITMTTDATARRGLDIPHDVISHMAISQGAKTIQCVRYVWQCASGNAAFHWTNCTAWRPVGASGSPCGTR
jgi:hypothetical protein